MKKQMKDMPHRNRKKSNFLGKLLFPLFCIMFLLGGCASEELSNMDWEAIESELALLEEMAALEEGAYEEQYGIWEDAGEQSENVSEGLKAGGTEKSTETLEQSGDENQSESVKANESAAAAEGLKAEENTEATENVENDDFDEDDLQYEVITGPEENNEHLNEPIDEDGSYTTVEDVALYLYTYDELPDNFMTKKEARELGWEGGSLEAYAPGMCIGGDYFGNYEGLLPEEEGRDYYECDIDTLGARSRGAKRIVYSDDGLIYYTDDHYESFTLLYGEE